MLRSVTNVQEVAFHPLLLLRHVPRELHRIVISAVVTLLLASNVYTQQSRLEDTWRWTEFSPESGLPSDRVLALAEAPNQPPWVLTSDGVAWYDGYAWNPVPFPHPMPLHKPSSFYALTSGSLIVTLDSLVFIGDRSGFKQLPVTKILSAVPIPEGGIMMLRSDDAYTRSLRVWKNGSETIIPKPASHFHDASMRLNAAASGRVWLSSGDCMFTWSKGSWEMQFHAHSLEESISLDGIVENASHEGAMLIASPYNARGTIELNPTGKHTRTASLLGEGIRAGAISSGGTILLSFETGLFRMRAGGEWSTFRLDRFSVRQVNAIIFRPNEDIWFGTDRGLLIVQYGSNRWQALSTGSSRQHRYINDIVLAADGALWLATGEGIAVSRKNGSTSTIERINGTTLYLATGVAQDGDGKIWVCSGSGFKGVFCFDGYSWKRIGVGTSLDTSRIHRIFVDSKKRVWMLGIPQSLYPSLATQGPGAFMFDNGTLTRWGRDEGLIGDRVYAMTEGRDSSLWFGTMSGISRTKNGTWKHWSLHDLGSPNRIFTLALDHQNRIWFSDRSGFLGRLESDGSITRIRVQDGLLSETVSEIRCDARGRIWCSTPAGLSVHVGGAWYSFDATSGLINAPLWPILCVGDSIFVGSTGGLTLLSVAEMSPAPLRVVVQDPLIGTRVALLRWQIQVPHATYSSARVYTRYRIDQRTWSPWSFAREASVPLEPGRHLYEVQAKPPFANDTLTYASTTGVFSYSIPVSENPRIMIPAAVLLAGLLIFTIGTTIRSRREKARQLREELRREQEHAARLAEVDRMKSRFFANISHEFRTPLTLILGPLEQAIARTDDEWARGKMTMAHRNAGKLRGFINQLLAFSKVEAGTMALQVQEADLVAFVQRVVQSFQSWAEQRHQSLRFTSSRPFLIGLFDPGALEKMLNNLISNAVKFTPEEGRILVTLTETQFLNGKGTRGFRITVEDSGMGIAAEHLPHIFERFYRVDESHKTEGTGIGLALTKELVELHHGTIEVQSVPGKGTVFTFACPLEGYAPNETGPTTGDAGPSAEHFFAPPSEPPPAEHADDPGRKPIVLVIDDSTDVRSYMRDSLISSYIVLEAEDGIAGFQRACDRVPDLIVSDIMMPKMDGNELCKAIKTDERTSHIPVILLTARSGMESKLEGLGIGADDYLTKPFDVAELLTRIKNLIEGRQKLRAKFSSVMPLRPGEIAVTSMDKGFLDKALAVVERHIGEEDFSVEEFSSEIAMSRMQLHRKLRALTNYSAGEFVRYVRLMRAQELLKKNAGTISEIAYKTGFGSVTYFSRCYHEHFGCTPSEAKQQGL